MENAARWIFSVVMAGLLLYACALFRSTMVRLNAAREELTELRMTEQALREENDTLSRIVRAAGIDCD